MSLKKTAMVIAILLAFPVIVSALDIISLIPGNVIAFPGNTNVQVPVSLDNNDTILALEFQINHTQHIILRNVTPTARMQNVTIEWKVLSPTTISVAALTPDNISTGSGAVANLIFDVNSSAVPGVYVIDVYSAMLLNIDHDIEYGYSDSLFTIL